MRRLLLVPALGLAFAASAVPAAAQAEACATAPAALRTAAQAAEPNAQRRALTAVATAEKLCEMRNRVAAERKFREAARALNLDYAQVQQPTTAAAQ